MSDTAIRRLLSRVLHGDHAHECREAVDALPREKLVARSKRAAWLASLADRGCPYADCHIEDDAYVRRCGPHPEPKFAGDRGGVSSQNGRPRGMWSVRSIAARTGLSRSTVHRLLKSGELDLLLARGA